MRRYEREKAMTEDRRAAAEAANPESEFTTHAVVLAFRDQFERGVRWADENPAPRTIGAAEFDQMEATVAQRGGLGTHTLLDLVEMLGIEVDDDD
jgi:hypothetical protein